MWAETDSVSAEVIGLHQSPSEVTLSLSGQWQTAGGHWMARNTFGVASAFGLGLPLPVTPPSASYGELQHAPTMDMLRLICAENVRSTDQSAGRFI